MSKLPRLSGKKVVSAFERAGFHVVRTKGSHHIMKREGTPSLLSVPVHGAKAVGVGLLKSQIEVAGLTVEQFLNLL